MIYVKTTKRTTKLSRRQKVLLKRGFELLETAEILADPQAMKAIRDAAAGRTKFYRLEDLSD